jgi:ATP-dependent RNA helicase DeaD
VHRSGRTGRAGKRGLAIVLVPDPGRRYAERMFQGAHVKARWLAPPTADDIAARDRDALIRELGGLVAEVSDDDRDIARTLLAPAAAGRALADASVDAEAGAVLPSAEDLVAALVRVRRMARPAPEELTLAPSLRQPEPRPRRPEPRRGDRRDTRGPNGRPVEGRPAFQPAGGAVWFTINVGRSKHADPKWLIPLLCRRGGISKREIGKIQILQRETRVEIAGDASARFAEAIRRPDDKDRQIHIERLDT